MVMSARWFDFSINLLVKKVHCMIMSLLDVFKQKFNSSHQSHSSSAEILNSSNTQNSHNTYLLTLLLLFFFFFFTVDALTKRILTRITMCIVCMGRVILTVGLLSQNTPERILVNPKEVP